LPQHVFADGLGQARHEEFSCILGRHFLVVSLKCSRLPGDGQVSAEARFHDNCPRIAVQVSSWQEDRPIGR
jgi:hypothetical protein